MAFQRDREAVLCPESPGQLVLESGLSRALGALGATPSPALPLAGW